MITPNWCLELVLASLGQEPFEPITACRLKYLTWKTAFLLAMTAESQSCTPYAANLHTTLLCTSETHSFWRALAQLASEY